MDTRSLISLPLATTAVAFQAGESDLTPGTLEEFEVRFGLVEDPEEGCTMWQTTSAEINEAYVWTVVDAEDAEYIVPGYRRIDRQGYVIAKRSRQDAADHYRSYLYWAWDEQDSDGA